MTGKLVNTFEIESDSFRLVGSHETFSLASRGLPQGSYTTLRTYPGDRILRLEQHVARLERSLPAPAPLELARVRGGIAAALERTRHPLARLRLTFAPPRVFVSVEPFEPPPESAYREGVRCVTLPLRRDDPRAKHTRFIATAASAYGALPAGVNEGLMLGEDGAILEGLSSNFFAVRGGALHTEEERALPGVTRAVVLEVARGLLPVTTRAVRVAELRGVGECFLTSVSREVLPVVEIDGRPIGDGRPGPQSLELRRRFQELVAREARPLRD